MLTNRVSFTINATDFTTVLVTASFRFWGLGGYYYFKETEGGIQYQKASTQTIDLGLNMNDVQIYPVNSWTFPDGLVIRKRQPPVFATVRNNLYLLKTGAGLIIMGITYTDDTIDNAFLDMPSIWIVNIINTLLTNSVAGSSVVLGMTAGSTGSDKIAVRMQVLPIDKTPYFPRNLGPDVGTGTDYVRGKFRTQEYPSEIELASDVNVNGLSFSGFALPFNDTKFAGYSKFTLNDVYDITKDATSNSIFIHAPNGTIIITFSDAVNRDNYFSSLLPTLTARAVSTIVINLPNPTTFLLYGMTRISLTKT